jgi:hypothetical protein
MGHGINQPRLEVVVSEAVVPVRKRKLRTVTTPVHIIRRNGVVTVAQPAVQRSVSEKVLEDSCWPLCCDNTVPATLVDAGEVLLCFIIVLGCSALATRSPVTMTKHRESKSRYYKAQQK